MIRVLTIKTKRHMKKKFLFGFLMLAMITLLSGMTQANKFVVKATNIEVSIKSPPDVMPMFILNNVSVPASATQEWICTLRPGVQHQSSATLNESIISADVQRTNYINQNRLLKRYYAESQSQTKSNKLIYREPRDGLRQSWQA
jgi:hypothetical protein